MTVSRQRLVAAGVALLWLVAAPAAAQTPAAPGKRPYDLSVGGLWAAPVSLGEQAAEYLAPDGSTFTLFRASNRLGQGLGLEVNLGFGLTRRLWAEGTGAWTRVPLESQITDDFESDDLTVSENASRFAAGGAIRWTLSERRATQWFLRGGATWLREVAAGSALTGDGFAVDGGVGILRTLRQRPRGAVRQLGLRIEGRVSLRSGGLSLGEDKLRVGPVVAGALSMGFR